MIQLITPENVTCYKSQMDSLFKARYKVFYIERKWDLNIKGDLEMDEFDHNEAHYLINFNDQDQVIGGVRLISTANFHMFDGPFSQFVTSQSYQRSNKVWESSRFFTYTSRLSKADMRGLINKAALEIFVAMNKFSLEKGIEKIVTLTETRIERMLRSVGWPVIRFGDAKKLNDIQVVAGYGIPSSHIIESLEKKLTL